MNRCVIVGAAEIFDYLEIKSHLKPDDFFVFCDNGLKHAEKLNVKPDLIVGDFDSYSGNMDFDVPVIKLACEKDDTDTAAAVKRAAQLGYTSFLFIGATGGRIDHTMGNLGLLFLLDDMGLQGKIADEYSVMQVISENEITIKNGKYSYFSIICMDGNISGLSITGAKFPLKNADVTASYQYTISNEVSADECVIALKNGRALLVKVY